MTIKKQLILLLLALSFANSRCLAQGMAEFGGTRGNAMPGAAFGIAESVHAAAAGLGAGMAASAQNGKLVHSSYAAAVKTQQVVAAQTKVAQQWTKIGCDLESKKKWAEAEKSFEYVLKVIAKRDGMGSPKSVPTLEHLVTVNEAQNKLGQAISFQKTVLAFKSAQPDMDAYSILKAQCNLSNLYVKAGEYFSAEPVLRQAVALCNSNASISSATRSKTIRSYAKVLRKVKKDSEAEALEAALPKDLEKDGNIDVLAPDGNSLSKDFVPVPAELGKTPQK